MSTFSQKVMAGILPQDADWKNHLLEAHRLAPGMSEAAFAGGKTEEGVNSYQMLGRSLRGLSEDGVILDLACGNGYLAKALLPQLGIGARWIGVDMSADELQLARSIYGDPRVSFILAQAEDLPVKDASVDVVLCHMAIMLIAPIEPVIREIRRVLRPGGTFAAVVNDRRPSDGFYGQLIQAIMGPIVEKYPTLKAVRTGDPRIATPEGVEELFVKNGGFRAIQSDRCFAPEVRADAEGIWNFIKNLYLIAMLPATEREAARARLGDFVKNGGKSEISFALPLRIFEIKA